MISALRLGDIAVQVVRKDIKNVHLSVHPPTGRVTIAAPNHLSLDAIRAFAIAKLGWVRAQKDKFRQQERETKREYIDRESHYVWGRRYLLKLRETSAPGGVHLKGNSLPVALDGEVEIMRPPLSYRSRPRALRVLQP